MIAATAYQHMRIVHSTRLMSCLRQKFVGYLHTITAHSSVPRVRMRLINGRPNADPMVPYTPYKMIVMIQLRR